MIKLGISNEHKNSHEYLNRKEMDSVFTRLVSNTNNWVRPSGHQWEKSNQRNPDIAYEKQYGFGHEEWLLNPRYHIDKMQYGYIRGLKSFANKVKTVPEVHLYTVQKDNNENQVFYIGKICNVEPISKEWLLNHPRHHKIFDNQKDLISEIEAVEGDPQGLVWDPLRPNIRFKPEDVELFDNPVYLPDFPLTNFKRFQPYRLTPKMENVFKKAQDVFKADQFSFESGKARQSEKYKRFTKSSDKTVLRTHTQILEALEELLKPTYSISLRNVSIEKTRFMGHIADLVTFEPDKSISIYEVKTSPIARQNIREAIAQLLDYASHTSETSVKKLVIVAPCKLKEQEINFLKVLRTTIKHKLEFLAYVQDEKTAFIPF